MSLCFRVPLNFPQGDDAVGATPIVYPFMSIAEFHENTIYTTEFGNGVVIDRGFMATIAGVSDVETAIKVASSGSCAKASVDKDISLISTVDGRIAFVY